MGRGYRHIQGYEKEIEKLKEEGLTKREIRERLGFTFEQVHNFISRFNKKKRKLEAGIAIKRKERPPKDCVVSDPDKVSDLKYILAWKEARIKSLEMESGPPAKPEACSAPIRGYYRQASKDARHYITRITCPTAANAAIALLV